MVEANLHNTIGAMFIGLIPSTVLYGVFCTQTWNYYVSYAQDPLWMKIVVGGVWVSDTANLVLICAALYDYTISNFANPAYLQSIDRPIVLEVLFNGVTALIVQLFFAWRIWRLSGNRRIFLTVPVLLLILIQFGSNLGFTVVSLGVHSFDHTSKPWTGALDATAALTDVAISAILCTILIGSRTEYAHTNGMIDKLILFSLNTGLVTSITAVAALIAYYALPKTLVYIGIYFLLGRLYANSLLATLNARAYIRNGGSAGDAPMSYSLEDRSRAHGHALGASVGRRDPGGISVQIETMQDVAGQSRTSFDYPRKAPGLDSA